MTQGIQMAPWMISEMFEYQRKENPIFQLIALLPLSTGWHCANKMVQNSLHDWIEKLGLVEITKCFHKQAVQL